MNRVLMLFVDGLGIPPPAIKNSPLRPEVCPVLCHLIERHGIGIDAGLGVPGLPQSATGQTAILTGVNAPAIAGRHIEGFPSAPLRQMICQHNIFRQLNDAGCSATFANGYLVATIEEVHALRIKSVTTVAALSAFGDVRRLDDLLNRKAVAHDLTRSSLTVRGYHGPLLTEQQAAEDLATIAATCDFTLFEFFQTDRAGHLAEPTKAEAVLQRYDRFLDTLLPLTQKQGILLVLTSDHGNIEDPTRRTHTSNPVPLVAYGPGSEFLRTKIHNLTNITPAIVGHLAEQTVQTRRT